MKKLTLFLFASIIFSTSLFSQTISPAETTEFCPDVEITFTVIVPGTNPFVASWTNAPIITQNIYNASSSGGNTTFNFRGKFRDANINQVFRVTYTNSAGTVLIKDFEFKRIKSLYYANSFTCGLIQPNQTTINAPTCQISNFNISFNNVQWQTAFETPELCFGSITTYQYLLPSGWKLGATTSNGTTWITANNNVTITSNLLGGGQIAVRAANNCNAGLQNGQNPRYININRSNQPVLKINGSTQLTINCGDAGAKIFTVENAGTCITSYEWQVANKGWYDASGNLLTANITTSIPSLTIYPSCNSANSPQNVSVKIKAGAEEITSTVTVSLSTAPPQLLISGPDEFCTSTSYSLPVSPVCGASITWSLEYLNNHPNVATLSCTNCQAPTLTKVSDGTVLLRATVTFPGCNSIGVYEKYIGVGVPVIRGWYNSPTNPVQPLAASSRFEFNWNDACYTTFISTNMDITANSTVVWEDAGNSGGVTWYQNGNNLNFYFSNLNQWAYFRATATNSCGTKSWLYRFRSVGDNCSGGTMLRVMIYPNPASSNITVGLAEKSNSKKLREIVEIRVTDKTGILKQKLTYAKSGLAQSRSINLSNLPPDVYTILVFDGKEWTSEKFVKQ